MTPQPRPCRYCNAKVLDIMDENGQHQVVDARQTVAFVIFSDGSAARAKHGAGAQSEHASHFITCRHRDQAKADQQRRRAAKGGEGNAERA